MTPYEIKILNHLGNLLMEKYCRQSCDIAKLSEWDFRDHLIPGLNKYWGIGIAPWPGERTFFRAFHEGKCSSAMKEKCAFFYFALVDGLSAEQFKKGCPAMLKRKQITVTPNWDRFVRLSEELEKSKAKKVVLPKCVNKVVRVLRKAEKRKLYEWLKVELGD